MGGREIGADRWRGGRDNRNGGCIDYCIDYQYTAEDRQGLVDHYVTLVLQMLLEGPWHPLPEITGILVWVGPLRTPGQIFKVFGGGLSIVAP